MAGLTPNQMSNLNFQNNLVLNSLDLPDKTALVYDLSNGYNSFDMIISIVNKFQSKEVTGLNGIYQKPIMGTSRVIAQVNTNALVGANLQLNFTDPNFDNYRLGDVVIDGSSSNIQGRVIQKGAGFVVLEPHPAQPAWNTAIHFPANTFALSAFDASGNRGSTGKTSLYEYPFYLQDRTGIIRESITLFRRDMAKTFVEFNGDFWYSSQDVLMMKAYARALEYRGLFSKPGVTANSAYEGEISYNMGLREAIKDPIRGGVYRSLTNAMTQLDFENFLADVGNLQANGNVELTCLIGRGALRQVQGFASTSNSVQFAGKLNTFGGEEVKGLDIRQYSVAGVMCNFILTPMLNDTTAFPANSSLPGVFGTRMSNTLIALDLANYQSVDGRELSPIEKIYFGAEETIYGYVPGLIGNNKINPSNVFKEGKVFATSGRDDVTFHIYSDCGLSIIANRMGWLELAS